MPPVTKTLLPSVISKAEAAETNCQKLYELFKEQLGTDKIAISVKGASVHSFGYSTHTNLVHLPRTNTFIAQHCPTGYEHFEVKVAYTVPHLDPNQTMTRAEFVIELLDLWEAMQKTLPGEKRESTGRIFTDASELLRSTYQVEDLADLDYLEMSL